MTLKALFIIAFSGIAVPGTFSSSLSAEIGRPNVILLVSESLRADHLGSYGYGRDTSPNLDGLAAASFLFTGAWSQAPCTNPAMANILTSRYQSPMPVPDDYLTLAEHFKNLGYRTAAVVEKNPFLSPDTWNLRQGFDRYDFGRIREAVPPATDRAVRWLEQKDREPFFLWVFYYAPHRPYSPPGEFRGYYAKEEVLDRNTRHLLTSGAAEPRTWRAVSDEERRFLIDAYDEDVRYMDHEAGRLLGHLEKTGLFDKSIIIFTADHGEELGDNGGLWDHCALLSEEEIHVPLLLKMPFQDKGILVTEAVQTIDIFPTLADLLGGGPAPSPPPLQGKSLRSLLERRGPEGQSRAAAFWKGQVSLAGDGYRYWKRGGIETLLEVPGNDAGGDGELLERYRNMAEALYGSTGIDEEVFDDTLERIRSLGYFR